MVRLLVSMDGARLSTLIVAVTASAGLLAASWKAPLAWKLVQVPKSAIWKLAVTLRVLPEPSDRAYRSGRRCGSSSALEGDARQQRRAAVSVPATVTLMALLPS